MRRSALMFAAAAIGAVSLLSEAARTESSAHVRLLGGMRFAGGSDLDFAGHYA